MKKRTIAKKIRLAGIGVHTGQTSTMTLNPSDSGRIVFRRSDIDAFETGLDPRKVEARSCSMLVTEKGNILTLEHLLAVLWVYGIDSLEVDLDGEEIPIMDGSALPFVRSIKEAGIQELQAEKHILRVVRPFRLQDGEASISAVPDAELRITCHIHFDHPMIRKQGISLRISPEAFEREIAPARTFGFLKDVPGLRAKGLALGGSLDNAVVLDEKDVISGPLRFPDEFVRHKVLDLLGDLALLQKALLGHIIANRAGHPLHHRAVRFILDHPEYTSSG